MTLRGEGEIERRRRYEAKRRATPEYRAKAAEYHRKWAAANPEKNRQIKRDWKRRHDAQVYAEREERRQLWNQAWGSLHDLGCRYPERKCRCKPVLLLIRP